METKSKQSKASPKDDQNRLFYVVKNRVPKIVFSNKNRAKTWIYGYSEKYGMKWRVFLKTNGLII